MKIPLRREIDLMYNINTSQHEPDNAFEHEALSRYQMAMPKGGQKGQVLTKNSEKPNDASWQDPPEGESGTAGLVQAVNQNLGNSEAAMWDAWDAIAAELNSRGIQPSDIAFLRMRNTGNNTLQHNPGAMGRSITIAENGAVTSNPNTWINLSIGAGSFVDFHIRDAWNNERTPYNWTSQMPTLTSRNHDPVFMVSMSHRWRMYVYPDSRHIIGQGLGSFNTFSQQSEPLAFIPNGNIWWEIWLNVNK
jgi:hypothetical protein